jgi:hypothetical protein
MIRQKQYQSVAKKLWGNALGRPSYFAALCAGAPIAIIRQYIEQYRATSNNSKHPNSRQPETPPVSAPFILPLNAEDFRAPC